MPASCSSLSSSTGNQIACFLLVAALGLVQLLNGAQPRDFNANHNLGETYVRSKDYRNAVTYLGAAYRLNPADYGNAFDLAQAEIQIKDTTAARKIINALLAQKDRAELHNLLGDCEEAAGNFREAANQYQIAARADPSEPNLFSFGAELLKYHGYREAVEVLSYAAQRYPQSARIRVAQGIAQYSAGDYRNAVTTFCAAVDLNPSDTRAFEFLGKMIGVAPELSKDVSVRLKHFVTAYPNNAAANYYYAMSLLASPSSNSEPKEGSPKYFLERAIAESPSFAEAHYQLGVLCEQENDTERAIQEFERAVQLQPQLISAHYRLARLYSATGQEALAQREYETLKELRAR